MNSPDDLAALLGQAGYAWLIDRLVARIEQGQPLARGTASLANPGEAERRALDDLLGRRSSRGKALSVDLAKLSARFDLSEDALRRLVETLRGPVANRRALREAEAGAWDGLFARWRERLVVHPPLDSWLDDLRASGHLKKASARDPGEAETLLAAAFRILVEEAPHEDILLASLAAAVTGDSHALDRGRPLAHLCLRAIERRTGIDGTGDADSRRQAWAAIGVLVDDLSAPVLCLNLPPAPGSDAAPWMAWHLERGEPFYLSWRQARAFSPCPARGPVFVCENPAIVSEAASRLGPRSRPLVCTNGVPSGAVRMLLSKLLGAGILLRMRADFDWAGIRILDPWIGRPGVSTWRMGSDDYRSCHPVKPLAGAPLRPAWAAELAEAMESAGKAAYEEELIDALLRDLEGTSLSQASPKGAPHNSLGQGPRNNDVTWGEP